MPVPDQTRSPRRIRRSLAGLLAAVALVGIAGAGAPGVSAGGGGTIGDELFGTYSASARANGVQITYDAENVFPVSPILQATVPEALATLSSGPSGYSLASLAYPGPLIADIGTVIALASEDAPPVPPYPVRQESFHPTGPAKAVEGGQGGPEMRAETSPSSSEAVAHYADAGDDQAVTFGNVVSHSTTEVLGDELVSRARTEVSDVVVLGGVLTIDSVVTDIVAVHDGKGGATAGRTIAQGVQVLGLDARLTGDGLELTEAPPAEPTEEEPPLPIPSDDSPLGQVVGPVQDGVEQVNGGAAEAEQQAMPPIEKALAQAGIEVQLLQPEQTIAEGMASRAAGGLKITFRYKGREQKEMNDLVTGLPPELRQSLGPAPNPVNMLIENHIVSVAMAPAFVNASAAPLFEVNIPEFVPPTFPDPAPPVVPDTPDTGSSTVTPGDTTTIDPSSGFETALPTPGSSAGSTGTGPSFAGPSATPSTPGAGTPRATPPQAVADAVPMQTQPVRAILTGAVPAFLALVLALAAPLFAAGAGKLADTALAPAATSCPHGRDVPDAPRE